MKKLFLTITTIAIAISSHAQDFAPLNAKWYFQNCRISIDDPITYSVVETVSDTLIDGKYSTITHVYGNNGEDFVSSIIIHEDQGRVYFFEQGEFRLFFDYNLNAGDTLTHRIPLNAIDFQANCVQGIFQEFDLDRTIQTIIYQVDTVYFDGIPLLQFWGGAVIPDNFDHSYSIWELGEFTQRLGTKVGLFGIGTYFIGNDTPHGFFRCYADDEITVEFVTTIHCDYTTVSTFDLEYRILLKAFPNPTSGPLKLEIPDGFTKGILEIVDMGAGIVHRQSIDHPQEHFPLDISHLPAGIYLLRMECNGLLKAHKRIVKQ